MTGNQIVDWRNLGIPRGTNTHIVTRHSFIFSPTTNDVSLGKPLCVDSSDIGPELQQESSHCFMQRWGGIPKSAQVGIIRVKAVRFRNRCNVSKEKTDWLAGWVAGCVTNWLTGWLNGCLTDWLAGWMAVWLTDWMSGWLNGCLSDWLDVWLVEWMTDWLAGWLTDWLTYWMAG